MKRYLLLDNDEIIDLYRYDTISISNKCGINSGLDTSCITLEKGYQKKKILQKEIIQQAYFVEELIKPDDIIFIYNTSSNQKKFVKIDDEFIQNCLDYIKLNILEIYKKYNGKYKLVWKKEQ